VSRRRSIALVVAVVGLLAVVALAAAGRPLSRNSGSGSGLPTTFWGYLLTTGVIVLALGAVTAFVALYYFRIDRPGKMPSRWRPLRSIAGVIAVAALIYFIEPHLGFLKHLFHRQRKATVSLQNTSPPRFGKHGGRPAPLGAPFEWPEVVVVVGLVLAAVFVYAASWRRRARPPRPGGVGAPEELMVALDESLDDLRSDPDIRRAIVAAYARMERALAAAGVPRDPAEAPLEYLERVLLSLDASAEAVRRLTDLFEWARFSHHEPEPSMRDEAVDALVAVRDELRAREPVETW